MNHISRSGAIGKTCNYMSVYVIVAAKVRCILNYFRILTVCDSPLTV